MINVFLTEQNLLLVGTNKSFAVLDMKINELKRVYHKHFLGELYDDSISKCLCFEVDHARDGKAFFMSFSHANTIDE